MLRAERSGNGWKKCFQNPHVNFSYVSLAIDEFSWQLLASMETRKSEFYSFFTCIVEGELSGHEFEPTLGDCERRGSHGVATAENSNYCRMFLILQILWKGFGDPQGFLWILFWGLLVYLHFIRGLQNGDTPVLITLEFVSWSVL